MFRAIPRRQVVPNLRVSRHVFEQRAVLVQASQFFRRNAHFVGLVLVTLSELHEPVGLGKGKRPKQNSVDNGKDRGVGADSECKRQDGNDRETRRFHQYAKRIADIVPKRFHTDLHVARGTTCKRE